MAKSEQAEVDPRTLNLYQKLAAITGDIGAVAKGGKNQDQKYDFIEYAAVAGNLRGLFAKYGVIVIPYMQKAAKQQRVEITNKYGGKGVAVLIDFAFVVRNADKPEEKFTVTWVGEAADYGDKATNKAATAALKYYLMRQFNISEKGEDPDEHSPERGTTQPAAQQPAPKAPEPAKPKAPEMITPDQLKKLFATIGDKGITGDDQKKLVYKLAKVESTKDLTKATAAALIDKISKADPDAMQAYLFDKPTEAQLKQVKDAIRTKIGNKFLQSTKVDMVLMGVAAVESLDDIKGSQIPELVKAVNEVGDPEILKELYADNDDVNQEGEGAANNG